MPAAWFGDRQTEGVGAPEKDDACGSPAQDEVPARLNDSDLDVAHIVYGSIRLRIPYEDPGLIQNVSIRINLADENVTDVVDISVRIHSAKLGPVGVVHNPFFVHCTHGRAVDGSHVSFRVGLIASCPTRSQDRQNSATQQQGNKPMMSLLLAHH